MHKSHAKGKKVDTYSFFYAFARVVVAAFAIGWYNYDTALFGGIARRFNKTPEKVV